MMKYESRKTEENIKIFHIICDVFGNENKKCKSRTYWDEKKENWINIVICPDSPFERVISYGTVALSEFSIGKDVDEIPLRTEIIGACYDKYDQFPNILSTCAFNIIVEHSSCIPGAIYPDVVNMYMPDSPMKHILFRPTFGWDKEFETLHFPDKIVAWLLAVPISDAEYHYARINGSEKLEAIFVEKQINIYDLERASIL
jgi:hypothetical protein